MVNPSQAVQAYAALDPPSVLAALDAVGLVGDGRLLQLNSYENRVFQVFLDDGDVVVAKFYRPGRWSDAQILEEHAFARELSAADVPVVPARTLVARSSSARLLGEPSTLCHVQVDGVPHRFGVADRRSGRAPDLEDPAVLRWIGRFLGRLHVVGAQSAFRHRRRLDVATLGHRAREFLLQGHHLTPAERAGWTQASAAVLARVERAFQEAAPLAQIRLHGDCHPGNILWRDEGPHVVDLDDACTGPAVQDLWMLLSGHRASMAEQLAALLEGYELFRPFDRRELTLIEPLRSLRMLHYSAWIAERWDDPAFPAAFPWFGTPAYWSQQTVQLREQLQAMASDADDAA